MHTRNLEATTALARLTAPNNPGTAKRCSCGGNLCSWRMLRSAADQVHCDLDAGAQQAQQADGVEAAAHASVGVALQHKGGHSGMSGGAGPERHTTTHVPATRTGCARSATIVDMAVPAPQAQACPVVQCTLASLMRHSHNTSSLLTVL